MAEETVLPFHSFMFTLIEGRRPRAAISLCAEADGMYALHVEKGPASKPTSQFTRRVPKDVAQRLRDALQEIGVFGWEESYASPEARDNTRWTVSTVFKEGVFSVASHGGSHKPEGFDAMLEELYRLDFPRPTAKARATAPDMGGAINSLGLGRLGSIGGMNAGDLGAYSAVGSTDTGLANIADLFKGSGMGDIGAEEIAELLSEVQNDPQALQQRMRDEFRHMPHDEQERMLDALASLGTASRAWWERFLRG